MKALIAGLGAFVLDSQEGQDIPDDSLLLLAEMGPQAKEAVPALINIIGEHADSSYCNLHCSMTRDALEAITGEKWATPDEWLKWWQEVEKTY